MSRLPMKDVKRPRPVKVTAGRYRYRGRWVIQTCWDGPRGGNRWRWEIGDDDKHEPGAVILDGLDNYRTMREAMDAIDKDGQP